MNYTLRSAQLEDGAAMGDILQDWLEETPWMPVLHRRDETQAFCTHLAETSHCWIAQDTGEVLGFVAKKVGWINALYLKPEARGQGIGSALLMKARSKEVGLQLWCFQKNHAAQRFYERAGFRAEEKTDGSGNDEKLPDIRYVWQQPQKVTQ